MTPELLTRLKNTPRPHQDFIDLHFGTIIALVDETFALRFELLNGTRPVVRIVAPNSLAIVESYHIERNKFPPLLQRDPDYVGSKRVPFDNSDLRRYAFLGEEYLLIHDLYLPVNERSKASGIKLELRSTRPADVNLIDIRHTRPEPRVARLFAMAA